MFSPETEIVESRIDLDANTAVYVVRRNGRDVTVSIPLMDFAKLPEGHAGVQPRRALLTKAFEAAYHV